MGSQFKRQVAAVATTGLLLSASLLVWKNTAPPTQHKLQSGLLQNEDLLVRDTTRGGAAGGDPLKEPDFEIKEYSRYARRNKTIFHNSYLTLYDEVVNPFTHEAILSKGTGCDHKVKLLIFVFSRPASLEKRKVIRTTWASRDELRQRNAKLIFLLGKIGHDDLNLQRAIMKEGETYSDVLQYDFIDHERNLTLKSTAMLQWANKKCKDLEYMLKVDEDVIVSLEQLVPLLADTGRRKFLIGQVIRGAKPIRTRYSKWFTPKSIYSGDVYPTYLSGTAYVISGDVMRTFTTLILHTKPFWLEDIYITGICAHLAGAELIHNDGFVGLPSGQFPLHKMRDSFVTMHGFDSDNMRAEWRKIQQKRNSIP